MTHPRILVKKSMQIFTLRITGVAKSSKIAVDFKSLVRLSSNQAIYKHEDHFRALAKSSIFETGSKEMNSGFNCEF